ncbi:hypothetical protein SG34_033450 [Thalassomonas viridans]|uniref:Uncharacterized protein n=1 Tax=Thalassomonas viridans TaxID=137584 RepID=A0AAE9Z8P0_9GAMM|nr:hypothetical protein [Thalassomonas viridans]WDE08801.1 hypothetical protein SG34_033450 [Thalassomonas viridans]
MPAIQGSINGVLVEFSPNVNKDVDQRILDALKRVIKTDIASDHTLMKIYISSANDQHELPSRHVQGKGKAVDISRINGMKMSVNYPGDATVKAIVDALQTEFENYPHKRENFGPFFKKKLGEPYSVSGHSDHIHFSVN